METRRFGKRIPMPSTRAIKHQIRRLMTEDRINELNVNVSEAIRIAEASEEGTLHARGAYARVSVIEAEIARLTLASSTEGVVARRGAVRAAVNAGDIDRARQLTLEFSRDCDEMLELQLYELLS